MYKIFIDKSNKLTLKFSKKILGITLLSIVFIYTYFQSVKLEMNKVLPHVAMQTIASMGAAISDLEYDLEGYRYYQDVVDSIKFNLIVTNSVGDMILSETEQNLKNSILIDERIGSSVELKIANLRDGWIGTWPGDIGYTSYVKFSFLLFGYSISSLHSFYFILLFTSITITLITFFKRDDVIYFLLILLCGHFVVLLVAHSEGMQLQTVFNQRFLPVLSCIASFYIVLLILMNKPFSFITIIGCIIQSGIMFLMIHSRSSALHSVIYIIFISLVLLFYNIATFKGIKVFGISGLKKFAIWPLSIVIVVYIGLKIHLFLDLNHINNRFSKHPIWHQIIMGLSVHPKSVEKYSIEASDIMPVKLFEKRLIEKYGDDDWRMTGETSSWSAMEKVLKDEFFMILYNDPIFIIQSYLYKPFLFIKTYFSKSYGIGDGLIHWIVIFSLTIGSIASSGNFLLLCNRYFFIAISSFLFSAIPFMISNPTIPFVISDASFLFTTVLMIIVTSILLTVIRMVSENDMKIKLWS